MLGGGSNILVRDEGVSGAVLQLVDDSFSQITVRRNDRAGRAGRAAPPVDLALRESRAGRPRNSVRHPGTVGGRLRGNAGGRSGDIGQFVESVTVMNVKGEISTRKGDDLWFGYRESNIDELLILEASLKLQPGESEEITRRMRKLWIMKKATQPLSFQSAGCIFKNPRGLSAGSLIEQAGLKAFGWARRKSVTATRTSSSPSRRQVGRRAAPDRPGPLQDRRAVRSRSGAGNQNLVRGCPPPPRPGRPLPFALASSAAIGFVRFAHFPGDARAADDGERRLASPNWRPKTIRVHRTARRRSA